MNIPYPKTSYHKIKFSKIGRQDRFNPLNETRFDNVEKSPSVLSNVKRVTGNSCFEKQLPRQKELFDRTTDTEGSFYDGKKDITMRRLTSHVQNFTKSLPRKMTPDCSRNFGELSCIDKNQVEKASVKTIKPKTKTFCNFAK